MVPSQFFMVPDRFSWFLVGFYASRLVFHGFSWFQVGFHVFSWFQVGFSWCQVDFMVYHGLGLVGRRPALA